MTGGGGQTLSGLRGLGREETKVTAFEGPSITEGRGKGQRGSGRRALEGPGKTHGGTGSSYTATREELRTGCITILQT